VEAVVVEAELAVVIQAGKKIFQIQVQLRATIGTRMIRMINLEFRVSVTGKVRSHIQFVMLLLVAVASSSSAVSA
jgi:hypothetical protein